MKTNPMTHSFSEHPIMKTLNKLILGAFATLVAAGCGEAVDINRVQPNVVKKDLFNGEWHYRAVVVDKQYRNADDFIGYEGGLERIKWEITETQLVALRSYERVPGTDPANPGEQNVVAVFPIEKHFDIKRDYNTVNGVQSNVIIENDFDRPWWERDYMRVDWSANIASGMDPFFFGINWVGWFGLDPARGASGHDRVDDNNPLYVWRTRISEDYIETTIDGIHSPDPYICYWLDPLGSCNSTRAKVKMSFKKIDPTNDYVPLDYPDFKTVKVGNLVRDDRLDADGNPEPIFTSTAQFSDLQNYGFIPQRTCMGDEVGTDGTGTFLVREVEGLGTRMCNPEPAPLGDGEENCESIVARCDGLDPLFIAFGPEDVGYDCDISVNDPDNCYEFTTPLFARFGYFRTDRFVVDRENGSTLTGRERLINRWNIWQQSRDNAGRPIPMAERQPKPVVYYANVSFPPDLQEANKVLERQWDVAFRGAVAAAKGIPLADVPQMFFIKENDCNIKNVTDFAKNNGYSDELAENGIDKVEYGNLEEACAVVEFYSLNAHEADASKPVFTWQQLGDLRYSMLNWTPKAELAGPLGYGPSAADPLTGEIVSANANVYGASLDTYSNWGADIVQLINGEITSDDVVNGTHIREYVESVRNRTQDAMPAATVDAFTQLFDARTAHMNDDDYLTKVPVTAANSNWEKIKGTGIEEAFVDTEMAIAMGGDPRSARDGRVTEEMVAQASPANWARTRVPQEALVGVGGLAPGDLEDMKAAAAPVLDKSPTAFAEFADFMGRQNMCFLAEQVEPAIADLAAQFLNEGLSRDEVVARIRARVYIGVTAHELGHTFGLRHNFEGSADPINFPPQFWGITDLGPERNHLLAETENRDELMYSSIMDYHQRFNSDFGGIGMYDKAAIKLGYAETVEVFDETENFFVARDWIGSLFLLDPQDIPYVLAGENANNRIENAYNETLEDLEDGNELALLDIQNNAGITPRAENIYRRRDIPMKDWLRNEILTLYTGSLVNDNPEDAEILRLNGLLDDDGQAPKVAVPYTFCSDAYAWGGNLTCNRWDKGVTSREIVGNAEQMYDFYYPFQAFRGERVVRSNGGFINGYIGRLQERTYQPMLNAFRYFYYYRRSSARIFPTIRDWSEASLRGMNFFAKVLQMPDTGRYCNDGGAWVPEADATTCTDSVDLGLGVGREFNTMYDNQYIFEVRNVGQFWDKMLAIRAITDSNAFFFRDFSSEVNRGAFSIGYYRVFPQEMLTLFGGLMLGDRSVHTPRLTFDDEGNPKVNFLPMISVDAYGEPLPGVDPDPEGDSLTPSASYRLRQWTALIGQINLNSVFDQTLDFSMRTRVALAGSISDPTYDPSIIDPSQIITFTHPETGVQYRAAETLGERSIGHDMLSDINAYAQGEWADARADLDDAELNGTAEELRAARVRFQRAQNKLDEKFEMVEWMSWLGNVFDLPG